jgi:hypothetical protein
MIRPASFRMNEQTASSNHYQRALHGLTPENVAGRAQEEFDAMVIRLRSEGVQVMVFDALPHLDTPDALFPNNWVSFHDDGTVALYPMMAPNRRLERREDIVHDLREVHGFDVREVVDFTHFEGQNLFLEGTGSMVLDRTSRKAYAALSPRTDALVLQAFCERMGYTPVPFTAYQWAEEKRMPIYHTNVMMSVGRSFAAICLECIDDAAERSRVENALRADGKHLVVLREDQIAQFAGNMLELQDATGSPCIVLSQAAFDSLDVAQRDTLSAHGRLVPVALDVIEGCGGGSARCMIAEVHLPLR